MLYKIEEGCVKEWHYGLPLAKVIGLPPVVLDVAENVSMALDALTAAAKESSRTFAIARRRKLLLGLKETLNQAESGSMTGKTLHSWLQKLQEEFIARMEDIESKVDKKKITEHSIIDEETVSHTGTTTIINSDIDTDEESDTDIDTNVDTETNADTKLDIDTDSVVNS